MSEKALEMLSTALDMEERGKIFYQEAADNCANDLGKQIFDMLRKDEIVHVQRIKKISDSIEAGKGWTDGWKEQEISHSDMKNLFGELAAKDAENLKADSSDIDALQVGVDLEQKAIKYYKDHLENATDSLEKEFLEKMVDEEYHHFKALADVKDLLTDPEAWFMMKERHLPSGP